MLPDAAGHFTIGNCTPRAFPALKNELHIGDNLVVLRDKISDDSVDLVYLDPPFNSRQDYNVIFKDRGGKRSSSQELVFEDTWTWNSKAEETCKALIEAGGRLSEAIRACQMFLGDSDMMAYIAMMAPRLKEIHRVLKSSGSVYLHCDPTASHYLKLVMDGIFGPKNFRNEIIWQRTSAHANVKSKFAAVHDVIFFYSRTDKPVWNQQYIAHDEEYVRTFFDQVDDEGRRYFRRDLTASMSRASQGQLYEWRGLRPPPSRCWSMTKEKMDDLDRQGRIHWPIKEGGMPRLKIYPEDSRGVPLKDVWTDIKIMHNLSSERRGYPTQKPMQLLERIIKASSNEGDTILDPFCGCGTAIEVAEDLRRHWIGIDVTYLAAAIVKQRLVKFGRQVFKNIQIDGEPINVDEALALARDNKFGFQCWAVGRLGAPPIEHRKGADRGIDGRIYFHDDFGSPKHIIISVKAGEHIGPAFLRELRGVVDRERAAMGILVCVKPPTLEMKREVNQAGVYRSLNRDFPRLQVITVEDIFADKVLNIPGRLDPYERKKPTAVRSAAQQLRLLP